MNRIKTLKMNYEFKNVFSKGQYYIGEQVIIYFMKNKFDYNRIGIAVGTKICKAVKRNRIKRIIRAAYQKFTVDGDVNYDIVFIWNKRADAYNPSYGIIYNDLNKAFFKFGIVK